MQIQYFGHSAFGVRLGEYNLVFDPFISGNKLSQIIDIQSIKCDYLCISHGHSDHIGDAELIHKNNSVQVIGPDELVSWLKSKGLKGIGMNIGGVKIFPFGHVRLTYAAHSSSLPDGSYAGNPVGFVIYNEALSFYFAGDTGLTQEMKIIPICCPPLQFAILPIGDHYTMGYKDALIAAEWLNCKTIVACHFDTFDPIKVDHEKAIEYFKSNGYKLIIPKIGEILNF